MNEKNLLQGGCLCGALRYTISGEPFDADYCYCRMCQKSIGAPVACWMDFKSEQITWLSGQPKEYQSSNNTARGFCPTCGCSISFRDFRYPQYFSLAIATLDNTERVQPNYHIYTHSRVSWLNITDECAKFSHARTSDGD